MKLTSQIIKIIVFFLQQFHGKLKTSVLLWISAHVNTEDNEGTYLLAWNSNRFSPTLTLTNTSGVAKCIFFKQFRIKPLITNFTCSRKIAWTIARLRKITSKAWKSTQVASYVNCRKCPGTKLIPLHIRWFPCKKHQHSYFSRPRKTILENFGTFWKITMPPFR